MRNGMTAIDGWSAVRKHVVSVSLNVFAYLMVQTAYNLLKYAAIYVRLMSDDIVLNDSTQGYAGSGTLPFASGALAQEHAGLSSVGYIGDGLSESTLFELEQTAVTIPAAMPSTETAPDVRGRRSETDSHLPQNQHL